MAFYVRTPLPLSSISLQSKAYQAYIAVLDTLGIDRAIAKPVYLHSDILQGKGLASSSADISVVAMATAKSHGHNLSMEQLASICLSIEPTDAPFYPGIVQFDYLNGTCCELLGTCPPIRIVMFDEGGTIDTVQFNHQQNLDVLIDEKEELMVEALAKFKGNQRILQKPNLYALHQIGVECNAIGTIIAHSGTVLGLLFPPDSPSVVHCLQRVKQELPNLTFMDIVETTNEGITFMER